MIGLILGRRSHQRRVASTLTIHPAAGIAEGRYVRIGGVDQWIQIRGANRANPILLICAGAGLAMEPFTPELLPWERHFTVVLWDRRDVGRTRGRNGKTGNETWTFDQFADEGVELVEFLCQHLKQDKVIVIGHSQGSIVGVKMARRRPDLFHAYVGTGQIADMPRNERETHRMALERARAEGNRKAVKALEGHPPPYADARSWITKQRWSMTVDPDIRAWQQDGMAKVLTWPKYTLADVYRSADGPRFMPPRLFAETVRSTPETLGTRFEVPVFVLHGANDPHTLPGLAEQYVAAIDAPAKEFVRLPGTGHATLLTRPDQFLAELLPRVRPLVSGPAPSIAPPTPRR